MCTGCCFAAVVLKGAATAFAGDADVVAAAIDDDKEGGSVEEEEAEQEEDGGDGDDIDDDNEGGSVEEEEAEKEEDGGDGDDIDHHHRHSPPALLPLLQHYHLKHNHLISTPSVIEPLLPRTNLPYIYTLCARTSSTSNQLALYLHPMC